MDNIQNQNALDHIITPSTYDFRVARINDYLTKINSGEHIKDEADKILTEIERLKEHVSKKYDSLRKQESDAMKQIKILAGIESTITNYLNGNKESNL